MAERPVFLPNEKGARLVDEISLSFNWHPGLAPSQKKKNIAELHQSAARKGHAPLLEISSKSENEVGQRLSAFNLSIPVSGRPVTIESAFQGSKVFESGGPFNDLYFLSSREAKKDLRLKNSGKLIKFHFQEKDFPLSPTTAFYDWLYVSALFPHRDWLTRLQVYAGFTDIEFNPERSLNCQARSCAMFMSLLKRGQLDEAASSFEAFKLIGYPATI